MHEYGPDDDVDATGMAYRTTFMHEYGPDDDVDGPDDDVDGRNDDVDTTAWNKDKYYSIIKM